MHFPSNFRSVFYGWDSVAARYASAIQEFISHLDVELQHISETNSAMFLRGRAASTEPGLRLRKCVSWNYKTADPCRSSQKETTLFGYVWFMYFSCSVATMLGVLPRFSSHWQVDWSRWYGRGALEWEMLQAVSHAQIEELDGAGINLNIWVTSFPQVWFIPKSSQVLVDPSISS